MGIIRLGAIAVTSLLLTYPADGKELEWDPAEGVVEGYTVTFYDEKDVYHKTVGPTVFRLDLEELNLTHGKKYFFNVAAFNVAGSADPSNEVEYFVPGYVPPEDKLPDPVGKPGETVLNWFIDLVMRVFGRSNG